MKLDLSLRGLCILTVSSDEAEVNFGKELAGINKFTLESISEIHMNVTSLLDNLDLFAKKGNYFTYLVWQTARVNPR